MRRALSRLASRLRRAASFSARDWRDLVAAQGALLAAQARVFTHPVGSLTSQGSESPTPGTPDSLAEATRLARSVTWAARYGVFRPKCLVRSLALTRLLERRGISGGVIRVGVRLQDRDFDAHAWVELDGRVLGDTEAHVGSFTRLPDLRVFERR